MSEKKVKELCTKCRNSTKIVDYYWDRETNTYTSKVKKIGYLCDCNIFSKKYYREIDESLGLGCKGFDESKQEIRIIYNNRVLGKHNTKE